MEITKKISLFSRTRALESEIDDFLDKLSQCSILFKIAIRTYLNEGCSDEFEHKLQDVNKMESNADHLRRAIETKLYAQTLIPEPRGDVLGLLENLDQLLNLYEGSLWAFSIEKPDIPEEFHNDFESLTDMSVQAAGISIALFKVTTMALKKGQPASAQNRRLYAFGAFTGRRFRGKDRSCRHRQRRRHGTRKTGASVPDRGERVDKWHPRRNRHRLGAASMQGTGGKARR